MSFDPFANDVLKPSGQSLPERAVAAMERQAQERQDRADLIRAVFQTEAGRALLASWKAWLAAPTYASGLALDDVAFQEGQKTLVRQIVAAVEGGV